MKSFEHLKKLINSATHYARSINMLAKRNTSDKSSFSTARISTSHLMSAMGMDYKRFSSLLPYRYFDEQDRLFINSESLGFGLEVAPLTGANEEIIHAIADLIKNKLDHTVCMQVMLLGGNKVGNLLDKTLSGYTRSDDMFKQIGLSQYRYLKHAALHGFTNNRKMNIPLRDYRCFVFVSKRCGYTKSNAGKLCDLRDDVMTEFKNAGLSNVEMSTPELIQLLKTLINFNPDNMSYEDVKIDQYKELHEQVVDPGFNLKVFPSHLEMKVESSDENGCDGRGEENKKSGKNEIVSLSLKELPEEIALWAQADNFSNILKPNIGISCPFVISVHFKCRPKERSKLKAFQKASSYEKKANSPYAKLIPGTVQAAEDWKKIRDDLASDTVSLCKAYYNCVLFTNEAQRREHVSQAISAFRINGMDLYSVRYQQLQSYLALMPFVVEQGLWADLSILGRANTMTTWNLTNLLPLVGEYKGSQDGAGFFAPTFRAQAACINNFDRRLDNFNGCIAATSGSGKSVLAQNMIASVLAQNGQVWVIDVGESYKKFCETLGGTYMDASNLRLNPFSAVENIAESGESIRDLIAVMASPSDGLSDVQKAHLLSAVNDAYEKKKQEANIDDVITCLESLDQKSEHDFRINDIVTLLEKYSPTRATKESFAARVFNEQSLLSSCDAAKKRFIVLELSDLEKQPELLKAVLFALILNIENQMYSADRMQKKLCVIDEAWRLLKGSNRTACEFIEKGFRTARKNNGSFFVISQKINDFYISEEAKAAWACSENKIIMRQNAEEFKDFIKEQPNYFNEYERSLIQRFMPSSVNGFSEFMMKQGDATSFHRLFIDPYSRVMFSSRAEEHQAIKYLVQAGMTMSEAIAHLSEVLYAEELKAINGIERIEKIENTEDMDQ